MKKYDLKIVAETGERCRPNLELFKAANKEMTSHKSSMVEHLDPQITPLITPIFSQSHTKHKHALHQHIPITFLALPLSLCNAMQVYFASVKAACEWYVRRRHSSCWQLLLTRPLFPKPTLTRASTWSATTLRLARASMPKIITAPRLCMRGSGLSEPTLKL